MHCLPFYGENIYGSQWKSKRSTDKKKIQLHSPIRTRTPKLLNYIKIACQVQTHIVHTSFSYISLTSFTLLAHGIPKLNSDVWLSKSSILWPFPSYFKEKDTLLLPVWDTLFTPMLSFSTNKQNIFWPSPLLSKISPSLIAHVCIYFPFLHANHLIKLST